MPFFLVHPNYIRHGGLLVVGRGVGLSPCSKIVHIKKCGGAVTQGRIQGVWRRSNYGWGGMVKRCCTRVTCEIWTYFGFC